MSTALRHSGLPVGIKPFELLDILEKLRSRLGLRDEDLSYLRCAFRLVRAEDFQADRICAFWEKVSGLADRLGFNVRRVARIESRLEARGLILRTSASNGRRFGRRAEDGRILSAGGINLAPLIERTSDLLAHLRSASVAAERLKDYRERANDLIRQIRGLEVAEALDAARAAFPRLRPSEIQNGEKLAAIIDVLEAIVVDFSVPSGRTNPTAPSDSSVRPHTHRKKKTETCSVVAQSEASMRVAPAQFRQLASKPLKEAIDLYTQVEDGIGRPCWRSIALAARERAMMLGISGADWDTARDRVGEIRAALCLLVADRNADRTGRFQVHDPAAAFIGLIRKETRNQAVMQALVAELMQFVRKGAVL